MGEELRFTIHAREQLRERDITEFEVREALMNVGRRRLDPEAIVLWGTTRNGRRLKIVLDRKDPRFVVTLVEP